MVHRRTDDGNALRMPNILECSPSAGRRQRSRPVRPGRTAMSRASTHGSEMICCRGLGHALREARTCLEGRRKHHNARRPHSALCYRPPAPHHRPDGITPRDASTPKPEQSDQACQDRSCAFPRFLFSAAQTVPPISIALDLVHGRIGRGGRAGVMVGASGIFPEIALWLPGLVY